MKGQQLSHLVFSVRCLGTFASCDVVLNNPKGSISIRGQILFVARYENGVRLTCTMSEFYRQKRSSSRREGK